MSNLSWIQYHILVELTRHGTRRYSQLRPGDVEGNLFAYHLKGLLGEKLLEKADGQYQLTVKGLQLVSTLSLNTGRTRQQPQILNAIICQNDQGEYLWFRWNRVPNLDKISFPHGMMHYGEGLSEAAARELQEKSGLQGTLDYRGHVYVRGMLSGVLDRHMVVQLFRATHVAPVDSDKEAAHGQGFWAPLESLRPEDFVPGFYEVAQLAANAPHEMIFADIVIEVS